MKISALEMKKYSDEALEDVIDDYKNLYEICCDLVETHDLLFDGEIGALDALDRLLDWYNQAFTLKSFIEKDLCS